MEKKRIDPAAWLKNWQIAQREARRIIRRAQRRRQNGDSSSGTPGDKTGTKRGHSGTVFRESCAGGGIGRALDGQRKTPLIY